MPITGTSLAYTFDDGDCPTRKPIQYFEMMGNRGLWHDGWMAVTRHEFDDDYSTEEWELHHLHEDFSESNNLAESEPDRLKRMIEKWWVEARRNDVLPLRSSVARRTEVSHDPLTYHFVPPMARVASKQSPTLERGSWSLAADVDIAGEETEGVIYAQGKSLDGVTLFVQGGVLCFVYTVMGKETVFRSATKLPRGRITVGMTFERNGDAGTVTLMAQGQAIGSVDIPNVTRRAMRGAEVGRNRHASITDLYPPPYAFSGTIHFVDIHVE
jgi:arylsulfatase